MRSVMKKAWEIAREGARKFGGSVKEYFAEALRMAWAIVKKGMEKVQLKGTEKQVKWAEDIRNNVLEVIELYELGLRAEGDSEEDIAKEIDVAKSFLNQTEAKFFIDLFGYANRKYENGKKFLEQVRELRRQGSMETPSNWTAARKGITEFFSNVGFVIQHDNIEWFVPVVDEQLNKKYF